MKNVLITEQILTGNLFNESGYDEYASAKNLAEIMEREYRQQAEADYPGAKIEVKIDVQHASGCGHPLEIIVTDSENEAWVDFPDTQWYEHQIEKCTEDYAWAVEDVKHG